jgi:hypothetical protein
LAADISFDLEGRNIAAYHILAIARGRANHDATGTLA